MNKLLQRTVAAYRPLYLRGLLLDSRYRLPKTVPPEGAGTTRRSLPAALSRLAPHRRHPGCDGAVPAPAGTPRR